MQYRKDKYGNDISALGFGCMRFRRNGPSIDMAEAEKEIRTGGKNGFIKRKNRAVKGRGIPDPQQKIDAGDLSLIKRKIIGCPKCAVYFFHSAIFLHGFP